MFQKTVQVGVQVVALSKWLPKKMIKLHWLDGILQHYLMMTSSV
jgi:hypothetical protein